ncbi:MAG: hypothetical protein J6N52_09945 [Clostridia bacterium]|nr:hypothetical protein [Clostridia bacterium]
MIFIKKIVACITVLSCLAGVTPIMSAENDDNTAYIDFTEGKSSKIIARMGSGDTVLAERDGRKGLQLTDANGDLASSSIYIELDDSFAGDSGDGNIFEVEVDYYDEGNSLFNFLYNSWDRDSYFAGTVIAESIGAFGKNTSIKQWKTAVFRVQDGKFENNKSAPDMIVSASATNKNTIQETTINEFGQNYTAYYLNTYGRTSTQDPIVIGGIRIRKTENKNPFSVKASYDFPAYTIFDDDPAKINYTLTNTKNLAYELNAGYKILDSDGNVVTEKNDTIKVEPLETKEFSVDLGAIKKYGELTFRAVFSCDGIENITDMPLCHCREAKEANQRLGANVHFEGADRYPQDFDGEYELLKRGGFSSVRDSLRWYQVEPTRGSYALTPMQKKEQEYQKKYGLDFLGIINIDTLLTGEQSSPETLEKFKDYCTYMAKEYKGLGEYFEADNEWNLHKDANSGVEDYIDLLKATYEGVKRGDPDAKLMGVDWGGYIMKDFRTLCETGCLDYMDAFSYHVYFTTRGPADGATFTQGEAVRNLLKEFGHEDMPLFLTENGWTDMFDSGITLEDEAQWHAQLIMQNSAWKTFDRIYPYEFADSGEQKKERESCYGIVDSAYSTYPSKPKPAYITTAMANWALSGAEFQEALDGMTAVSELYAYKYSRKNDDGLGNNMIVLWTTKDREQLGLKLGTDRCKMYDMYGNECDLQATNGVFSFALTYRPIYLIGDFDTITKAAPQVVVNDLTFSGASSDTVIQNIQIEGADGAKIVPTGRQVFEIEENNDIKDGKSRYVLKTPANTLFNRRAEYDIVKDGAVLYHGDIRINSADTISINVEHKMLDTKLPNRWVLDISVTNNRNSSVVSGNIKINSPSGFTKLMSGTFKDLAPQETKKFKFFMPEIVTKEMRLFDMSVNLTTGESLGYTEKMFFTVVPYAYEKPVVDGKAEAGEYGSDTWFDIKAGEATGQYTKQMYASLYDSGKMHLGDEDLSAKATMKYDEENIWFFIDVTDDTFVNNNSDSMSWDGDSIQLGITDGYVTGGGQFCEMTIALTPEGPQAYRTLTNSADCPIGMVEDKELVIVRDGNHTRYELRLPWNQVLADASNVKPGYKPKFALLLNEDDGLGRNSYLEYSQVLGAIGTYKDVSMFSDMTLAK